MLVKTFGSAVYGVEAITITIEVNVTEGLHTFVVGLADSAVKESIQRIESAIKSNGYHMPRTKLVINLAPAGIRKYGTAFDLPIAMAVLAASGQLPNPAGLEDFMIMGELGLDGAIHPIKGILPMAIQAAKGPFKGFIVPRQNAREAAIVDHLQVFSFKHLCEVIGFFRVAAAGDPDWRSFIKQRTGKTATKVNGLMDSGPANGAAESLSDLDFGDVKGQEGIKRALEIAAAGGHNAILIGPPGAGKTMLARRLPTILPPLSLPEALETTKIHSVADKLPEDTALLYSRPFRSPHHTISAMALIGGGSIPQPGEVSLAHNGILFLDELPEFSRNVLEVLRQPMEDRKVTISRAKMSIDFPAAFILLASMNPCPCGYYNHPAKECTCPGGMVAKYLHKISGPLLDRIDLHVEVAPVPYSQLSVAGKGETSRHIRHRVIAAREIQHRRYEAINRSVGRPGPGPVPKQERILSTFCNAQMNSRMLKNFCRIDTDGENLLRATMERLHLSARAHDHILKVSRTIADLAGSPEIQAEHLAEAIQYRSLDRDGWGR
jgi:magnesium chelatase family protein